MSDGGIIVNEPGIYEFNFISTPSHGYLVVPLRLIKHVGFVPTCYSMQSGESQLAFLEEDCDAGAFMKVMERKGAEVTLKQTHRNDDNFKLRLTYFPDTDNATYKELEDANAS